MTAEIIIMNKVGIALAADSKVTIGRGVKAFDTVTKIFQISHDDPIALMVWGNPDFMEIPIEIICKEYRSYVSGKTFKTVESWAADFIKYLSEFEDHPESVVKRNVLMVVGAFIDVIQSAIADAAHVENVTMGSPEYVSLAKDVVNQWTNEISEKNDHFSDADFEVILKDVGSLIVGLIDSIFDAFGDDELSKAVSVFVMLALKTRYFSPASMGFVIAGYGRDEIFPSIVEIETDGYLGSKLKLYKNDSISISRASGALIKPFAQGEMVHRFMDGADPEHIQFSLALFQEAMTEGCLDVLDKYGSPENKSEDVKGAVVKAVEAGIEKAMSIISQYQRETFSSPIVGMVKMLPKDELPHLAESLVALTSLKRHVSHDAETVGGPIDVALISKGEGLIWIKRKHYFRPELNPQFFVRYGASKGKNVHDEQRENADGVGKAKGGRSKGGKTPHGS